MEAIPEDQHSQHAPTENLNAYRSMRDRMHPPRMSAPSCIVPPTEQLVIRPHIVPLLPIFHGMDRQGQSLRPRSIQSWTDLQAEFLKKFFPNHRTNDLKRQISNFSTKENEKFYECWERYMEAINACPHYGFDTWLLVSYFYDGMSSSMKQLLETMCGGDFISKNPEETMDFLSYVAEVSRGWDEPNAREVGRMNSQPNASNAKAISDTPMQAKPCSICQSFEHLVEECPTMPAVVGDFVADQKSINDQFRQVNAQIMQEMANRDKRMDRKHNDLSQKIDNLQYQISTLTNLNTVQEKGKFPSQPHQNPKVIHEVKAQEGESSQMREVKAMITLRSGKEVDLPTPKPEQEPENEAEKEKREKNKEKKKWSNTKKEDLETKVNEKPERTINQEEVIKKHMPPPFPQALHGKREINNASEILEVLRQVKCKSPVKYKDLGCPTISMMIGDTCVEKVLLDLGASVNLLPYFVYKLITKGTNYIPIILGRPFLVTSNAIINCRNGVMQLTFGNMTLELNIFYMCNKQFHSGEEEGPKEVCMIDNLVEEYCDQKMLEDLNENFRDLDEGLPEPLDSLATLPSLKMGEKILPLFNEEETQEAIEEEPLKLILKPLPTELKYAYLEENKQNPIVISSSLTTTQEGCLLEILIRCKKAIGWKISDLKGISPLVCTHHIYMEEEAKPVRQPQQRLNPHMQEVVRAEVLKLLKAGIIYPISDCPWVSPTQVVPKKSRITMVQNDKGEEVSTRLTSGWRVCIDYRKLNVVTKKDHFPLSFIDQVLERVSSHPFYCFLDGYSGYFQIEIAIEDQENTTFTCPFRTYAYRRMPFGLCNAPATFQRCMLSIFSDMVERIMEVCLTNA
ncbi:Transposon Ty3-I Gag-Pol polyprotein [Vitis vinifera]|uniref:Transposon Ty3-I Gag-Pol polyprotein n=1 Tax=Vitis vinifera TaxID=29760 RepID=A0A438FCU1_VITVI|nr:Transposon Ty3-I Gag-Pol polyprotein [Vitis vinifera]